MLVLNDPLQSNIASVVHTVHSIERYLDRHDELNMDQTQQIAFCCAELALLSLAASDEVIETENSSEKMIRQELSSALKQIAIHFLNVQEWESAENIRAYFGTISKHCKFIERTVELPEEPAEESREELNLVPLSQAFEAAALELISSHSDKGDEAGKLKAEIQALREILASLVFERDNLLHVVCKEIEADYMRELGSIEAEIYYAECEVRYLQRKLEMMQASINRRESFETEKIDEDLHAQYEEYQRIYEEFVRRIREAAEFQRRRKKKTTASEAKSEPRSSSEKESAEEAKSPPKQAEESEEKQLKKLYRKIVKAMHPDLHPNQDEATKELFKRAIQAYKDGDLKTLNEIASTFDPDQTGNATNLIEDLRREKARILTLIRTIRAEIQIVKSRYPYTKKEILDDPVKLAEEKKKLNARLARAKKEADIYQSRIEEMEQKHGGSDRTSE